MTGTIYIIKNKINSKVYIGKTLSYIDKRFAEHKRDSLKYFSKGIDLTDNICVRLRDKIFI